ncbi:MAG: hypothetical protein BWZ04_00227 [Firmicutes bacterium ADurb.BinA205]|nr:MAG: hypothetical protein BWZ04_00227 [Firmicutes bacterium ADurb.BinA205]
MKNETNDKKNSTDKDNKNSTLMQRETDYSLCRKISERLLNMGLLTEEECIRIDTILRQKFRPSLSMFISENP